MTLNDFIVRWNNNHRYDFWWRQKHNIAFNSEQHRQANPVDIAFEYFENALANKTLEDIRGEEEKDKLLKKGTWIKRNEKQKEREKELMSKIDWSKYNG